MQKTLSCKLKQCKKNNGQSSLNCCKKLALGKTAETGGLNEILPLALMRTTNGMPRFTSTGSVRKMPLPAGFKVSMLFK